MNSTASIAIFHNALEYTEGVSNPVVPNEVFETAKRVQETGTTETVRSSNGLYIIEPSASGPFKDGTHEAWMNVHVIRVLKWHSGGIKKSELEEFEEPDE